MLFYPPPPYMHRQTSQLPTQPLGPLLKPRQRPCPRPLKLFAPKYPPLMRETPKAQQPPPATEKDTTQKNEKPAHTPPAVVSRERPPRAGAPVATIAFCAPARPAHPCSFHAEGAGKQNLPVGNENQTPAGPRRVPSESKRGSRGHRRLPAVQSHNDDARGRLKEAIRPLRPPAHPGKLSPPPPPGPSPPRPFALSVPGGGRVLDVPRTIFPVFLWWSPLWGSAGGGACTVGSPPEGKLRGPGIPVPGGTNAMAEHLQPGGHSAATEHGGPEGGEGGPALTRTSHRFWFK
ncbi:formin-like protein 5 [Penaeus monodon]|uniref:formin-like protein 5 n=1 Tax=Penaeus monodon TaxID=6687 RepID=UPI0018A7DEB0|nr:formin-like protein 5 [Penaeus monodon]